MSENKTQEQEATKSNLLHEEKTTLMAIYHRRLMLIKVTSFVGLMIVIGAIVYALWADRGLSSFTYKVVAPVVSIAATLLALIFVEWQTELAERLVKTELKVRHRDLFDAIDRDVERKIKSIPTYEGGQK